MNSNSQRGSLLHAINILGDSANAAGYQTDHDSKRRKLVESAVQTKPVFIPLQFNMTAAGRVAPYRVTTETMRWDTIVVGLISDSQTRPVSLQYTDSSQSLLRFGDDFQTQLRADDVAGQTQVNGGGQLGVFHPTSPIVLPERKRFTVEMYKTDDTEEAEQANIVLVAVRVLKKAQALALLDNETMADVLDAIASRPIAQPRFLKVPISFDAAGVGGRVRDLYTPPISEPLLIRGFRTNLKQSTIELGLEGEEPWTQGLTPIWSVCGGDELVHENYQWCDRAIFLPAYRQVHIREMVNGLDGVHVDDQTGGFITIICDTL